MNPKLEVILDRKMTGPEAEAYKIAVLWEEEIARMFPSQDMGKLWSKQNMLPKRGDPRKSYMFRHCWKLRREMRGLLRPDQMRLYIIGNLTILKKWDAYIGISTLCGDKAWVRWKVYERWYRHKENQTAGTPELTSVNERKIVRIIDRTKKFIFETCEGEPTKDKLEQFVKDGIFKLWVNGDRVCKYYVVLSPFMADHVPSLEEDCNFDPKLFLNKATEGVRAHFREEFAHEFGSVS